MPSQHGPQVWVQKEAKRLAAMSAEIVKDAVPPILPKNPTPMAVPLADNPLAHDSMIPEALQKGMMMTKISDNGQKSVLFRIDPDEGQILYKSNKGGIGVCYSIYM